MTCTAPAPETSGAQTLTHEPMTATTNQEVAVRDGHEPNNFLKRALSVPTPFASCLPALRRTQDRTRKALAAKIIHVAMDHPIGLAPHRLHKILKLQWNWQPHKMRAMQHFWKNASALSRCRGVSLLVEELLPAAKCRSSGPRELKTKRSGAKANRSYRAELRWEVWCLEDLVDEHLRLYPPTRSAVSGWLETRPLLIEPHHVIPLQPGEAKLLRSAPRFRQFCLDELRPDLERYQRYCISL